MNKLQNGKITALYERLSNDDERKTESLSIAHQKQMLESYAQRNGFGNIHHFFDDGITGTSFNRPGLNAMLEEIKAGNVATVIIKDQSRIGRDVVEVGLLKRTFDEYNVRFIAAEDGLDTAKGFDIMSLMRDVFNEFYVADTSKKIKAVFKSRMEKGLRCSGSVSYGYYPDPEDNNTWHIDEEAAVIVRRIFQMIVDGKGINDIGRILRAEQVPIPSEHWKRKGMPVRAAKYADPYAWSGTTISYILKRPEYKGCKVLGKTVKDSYKHKKHRKTTADEQYTFDGAIPAIVDEELWNNAQRLRKTKRRPPKKEGPPHRLTGLLFCPDCGHRLTHRETLVQKKWLDDAYVCSSYRQLTRDCAMHYIPTKNLEKLILNAIRRISWYVKENEKEFIQKVREASSIQQEESVRACKRQLRQAEKRFAELDSFVKKVHEQNATGKLSDRHYERLLADYDNEQATLETTITELQTQINTWSEDKLKTDKFINLVKRYTDFSELTTPMLNEFVERVFVHEGIGRGKIRRQRVDIHLNFIGAFQLPADFITPMEIEEQRQAEEAQAEKARLAKEREKERYTAKNEANRQKSKEFYARRAAGLLTAEEEAAYQAKLEHNRIRNKEWRDKRQADMPPKPLAQPRPLSIAKIAERVKEGLPLTEEETAKHEAYKVRKNAQFKRWRAAKKANEPPKPPKPKKPTKKERYNDIAKRKKAGLLITQEEQELHEAYREERRACHKKWRDSHAEGNPESLAIADIKKRMRDNLPLTPEQTAFHADWKAQKNEQRREYYHAKKAEMAVAVGQ